MIVLVPMKDASLQNHDKREPCRKFCDEVYTHKYIYIYVCVLLFVIYLYITKERQGSTLIFFLNLAVGQPSNNMDLSEIEICLGMIMIFSFGICIIRKEKKISGRTYICFFYHFRIYCAWSTLSHDKPSVFLSRSSVVYFHHPFYVNYQEYISNR